MRLLTMLMLMLAVLAGMPQPARATNLLKLVQVVDGVAGNVDVDDYYYGAAISPDGKHVYIGAGYDEPGYIIVTSRDPATGQLTWVETQVLTDPAFTFWDFVNVVVSPDGKNVYATSWEGWNLNTFSRDAVTGKLTYVPPPLEGPGDGLQNPWDMDFSADGTRLYFTGDNGTFSVYDRNPTTGALTLLSTNDINDFSSPGDYLTPTATTVSPDGQYVYLSSYTNSGVMTLKLLPNGDIDFVDLYGEGISEQGPFYDAHGLLGRGSGVVVSLDGKQVYVNSPDAYTDDFNGGVGTFDRDVTTGVLTPVDVTEGTTSGLEYLDTMAMQPDGRWIYATGDPITLYHRDSVTGRLTRVEQHHDVDVGQTRVSPDGKHVYVVETDYKRVAIYRFMGCAMVPATGCRQQALPGKGSLVVKNDPDDSKDVVVWKWAAGEATTFAEFDSPLTSTDYSFCIYDQSGPGGAPHLLVSTTAPPGGTCRTKPCWKQVTNVKQGVDLGFNYTDALRTNDGLNKITVRQGIQGKATASAKVGGRELGSPAPPLTGTVTAQLIDATSGLCWQATYSTPTLNVAGTYRARGD